MVALSIELPEDLAPRSDLKVESFALVEHCRAISRTRVCGPLIARLTEPEIATRAWVFSFSDLLQLGGKRKG